MPDAPAVKLSSTTENEQEKFNPDEGKKKTQSRKQQARITGRSKYLIHLAERLELVDKLVHEVKRPLFCDDKVGVVTIQDSVKEPAVVLPRRQVLRQLGLIKTPKQSC